MNFRHKYIFIIGDCLLFLLLIGILKLMPVNTNQIKNHHQAFLHVERSHYTFIIIEVGWILPTLPLITIKHQRLLAIT